MKVCFTCFEFKKENLRRQPWRYIYEISRVFADNGIETVVLTDVDSENIGNIRVRTINGLNSFFSANEICKAIDEESPELVIMNLGLTNFIKFNTKLNMPVIGVLTSPIYYLREIIHIGLFEFFKNFNHTFIHLVGALIPKFVIKRNSNVFDLIVVLSEENKIRLENIGVSAEVVKILPGIDESFLSSPNTENVKKIRKILNPDNIPLIMYYTSPLTLRGTDTLIKAFSKVHKKVQSKLIILSRREHDNLIDEERYLTKLAQEKGVSDSVEIISKYLDPESVKEYVASSDIVCLPFKIVISEIPISILESMALGKPVISTNIACIPELINSKLIVQPNNSTDLADAILYLIDNKELCAEIGLESKEYMNNFPRWHNTQSNFLEILRGFKHD